MAAHMKTPVPDTQQASPATPTSTAGRRRVLLAGGASTVLLSVKTGSALAAGRCVSPSAYSSISALTHASQKPIEYYPVCQSHGYYGNGGISKHERQQRWGVVDFKTATLANRGFTATANFPATTKLLDILQSVPYRADEGDLVTVYLDAINGRSTPYISVDNVLDMWAIMFRGSVFSSGPFSGWTASDVRNYLNLVVS